MQVQNDKTDNIIDKKLKLLKKYLKKIGHVVITVSTLTLVSLLCYLFLLNTW